MKQLLKLTLLLLAILLPATAIAHDFEVDGIYYNINGNEAIVTFRGTTASDYSNEYSGNVSIPATVSYDGTTYSVTAIGASAFYYCGGLKSIIIPSSVTSIGDKAFYYCGGLSSITIPSNVASIGKAAFGFCSGLNNVYTYILNTSQVSMGTDVFYRNPQNYTSRVLHVIEGSLTAYQADSTWSQYFGSIVEMESPDLPKIVFADAIVKDLCVQNWDTNGDRELSENEAAKVESLGKVFCDNDHIISFNELQYFIGLLSINEDAFGGCTSMISITIPQNVTRIESFAFYRCIGLASITIPSNVTYIGGMAFYKCTSLTSITIPSSVTTIGSYPYGAFEYCTRLASITVSAENPVYDSRENCNAIIKKSNNELIVGCKNTVIPSSVTSIGDYAFSGRSGLTSITIPSSVTSIGEYAFSSCTGLTAITIPSSVTSIDRFCFWSCTGLNSVMIPSNVTFIGYSAFSRCSGLASITVSAENPVYDSRENCNAIIKKSNNELIVGCKNSIIPSSVTSIGGRAFSYCTGLNSIMIPSSVTSIGSYAFEYCTRLASITCLATTPPTIDSYTFDSSIFNRATLYVPAGSISNYQNTDYWKNFISIQEVSVLVTSITLNKVSAELTEGNTLQLTATVLPDNASNKSVLWTTSNSSVATVSSNGLVTAITPGTATITATTTDGSNLSASCIVTVYTEMMGDVDGNGSVNISDVTALVDYLLNGDASAIVLSNADCDANEAVNISDVTLLIDYLLTGHWQEEPEPTPEVTSFTVNGVTFAMVSVNGGTFTMGATDEQGSDALDREKPAHQVTLSSYRIGETEVTQELWVAVMGSNPSNFSSRNGYPENLSLPVEYVSWNSCQTFISKLNELTGEHFRLPTEAEWEFAARGGTRSMGFKYAGSNDIDVVAWYKDNSNSITHAVGSKAPNELGLYDMSGNVWEWCQDWYDDYPSSAQTDPTGPATGTICVYRGGGWSNNASYSRVSSRSGRNPTNVFINIGLRLALDSDDTVTPSEDEEYVDLGLPSGTIWATKNIGAQKPEDFGEYLYLDLEDCLDEWADKSLLWQSSNIANGSKLSWDWPTKGDLEELVNECTWEWTTRNSVNGYQVTGPNGNSLFLPAAGYYYYEDLDTPMQVGSDCDYWSGTISYVPKGGYCAFISCLSDGVVTIDINFNKKPVRPVLRNY